MTFKNLFLALALILISILVLWSLGVQGGNTVAAQAQETVSAHPTRYLYMGDELKEPKSQTEIDWLQRRKLEQEKRARDYRPFHDFKYVDRLPESGITFKNSVTDDAKKNYKANHYRSEEHTSELQSLRHLV